MFFKSFTTFISVFSALAFALVVKSAHAGVLAVPDEVLSWGINGQNNGEFTHANSITVDTSGNVYVVDENNDLGLDRVQKFDSDGNFVDSWGNTSGSGDGQFSYPVGIAYYAGNVFVADFSNARIQSLTTNGVFVTKWGDYCPYSGGWVEEDGCFNGIKDIAANANDGIIYALDGFNRVQAFDEDGNFLFSWGSTGSGDGQFLDTESITSSTVGGNERVYVSDNSRKDIQVFDFEGNFITKWGSYGTGDGQFESFNKISAFQNYIFVSDNTRVQIFDLDGTFLYSMPVAVTGVAAAGNYLYTANQPSFPIDAVRVFNVYADMIIEETDGSTDVVEYGATDEYHVSMTAEPVGGVDIRIDSDLGQIYFPDNPDNNLPVSTSVQMTFGADYADVRTIKVAAIGDAIAEGDHEDAAIFSFVPSNDFTDIITMTVNITDGENPEGTGSGDEDSVEPTYGMEIHSIDGQEIAYVKRLRGGSDDARHEVIINTVKPVIKFKMVDVDGVEIEKYQLRLTKTDEFHNKINPSFNWSEDIKPRSEGTYKEDGFRVKYKNGYIYAYPTSKKTQLKEGVYYVNVRAYDSNGEKVSGEEIKVRVELGSEDAVFTVQNIGSIAYETKYTEYHYTAPYVTFIGTASSDTEVQLFVDGAAVDTFVSKDGSYSLSTVLSSGVHSVEIRSGGQVIAFSLNIDETGQSFPETLRRLIGL